MLRPDTPTDASISNGGLIDIAPEGVYSKYDTQDMAEVVDIRLSSSVGRGPDTALLNYYHHSLIFFVLLFLSNSVHRSVYGACDAVTFS